jgi:N-acetylmuramoyl-L-alanine amidase
MIIENHWLKASLPHESIVKKPSPNIGHKIDLKYLVIHYTATDTALSAISWFNTPPPANPNRIAAHVVVDLDGSITQQVPFNRKANHAGFSVWDGGLSGFNLHSVGIEIVNPGYCLKLPDGSYSRIVNDDMHKSYPASFEGDRILNANHKHKFWTAADNHHWFLYPQVQLDAVFALCKLLMQQYHLTEALGHEDLSPGRKPDPGPMFPWDSLRKHLYGHSNQIGKIYTVSSPDGTANLRADHAASATKLKTLPNGYELGLIETFGNWSKVYLVDKLSDVIKDGKSIKTIGWVHSSLITLKALGTVLDA